jgi:hypothetical protein
MIDYQRFLKIKSLPQYRFQGRTAIVPDEYAALIDMDAPPQADLYEYTPSSFLFDYQRDIARLAIRKRRFSVFADCGLGKTLIYGEFAKYVHRVLPIGKAILIVSPLMVVSQTLAEYERWYGDDLPFEQIRASELSEWLKNGGRFGITNFEALSEDLDTSRVGCLIIDESSMLKSHYGKWGRILVAMGAGTPYVIAGTGTPAPNDRIEYANHAVLMGAFPNINAFLARYFVNRGQTAERWALKPHAIGPFYTSLSHWCIFLTNPATYGWRDHAGDIPPIHTHIDLVPMTDIQIRATQDVTGQLFATHIGGIGMRSRLGRIAKGSHNGKAIDTNKPAFIRKLIDSWPDESTIIWCIYNAEQELMGRTFPEAASISGDTPLDKRMELIGDFKSGRTKILITKPKILGFGLNLQVATRQVFSGLQDSYEAFYQAVKRSNRVGSVRPLNVHIPVTQTEMPMIETVLRKSDRVQADGEEQERIFKNHAIGL